MVTAANVHDLTQAGELVHGDEEVVYNNAGYQWIAKRPETAGTAADFGMAWDAGSAALLPDTSEGRRQELIETAKAQIRA